MAAQEVGLVATESSCLFPTDCFPFFFFFKENIAANGNDNSGIVGGEFSPLSIFFSEHFPPFGVDSADVKRVKLSTGTPLVFFFFCGNVPLDFNSNFVFSASKWQEMGRNPLIFRYWPEVTFLVRRRVETVSVECVNVEKISAPLNGKFLKKY